MITSKVTYLGDLRTSCEHIASGTMIITDAPVDNQGRGEAFSPTDLVASSFASCMLTIIGIYCANHQLNFKNGSAEVTKIMGTNPRKIDTLVINLNLANNGWDELTQQKVTIAAKACPVAKTLEGNINVEYTFTF